MMRVIDLFAGIGGFSLAAHRAGWETVQFVEIEKYPQQVLKKNFPNVPIHGDIRTYQPKRHSADIVCGGFPCQPFSQAGQRKGAEDDRYLWPEMLRVIREVQPAWVVGENVAGLVSMDGGNVLEQVFTSLEGEGYAVQAFIIPAISQGAPHRRDRIWIVANRIGECGRAETEIGLDMERKILAPSGREESSIRCAARDRENSTNSEIENDGRHSPESYSGPKQQSGIGIEQEITSNAFGQRCQGWWKLQGSFKIGSKGHSGQWSTNWHEAASRLCRMDDGLHAWVDASRTNRLKALGNAIVPQVAYHIFQAINKQ